jgi:hypothetical protein
MEVKDKLKLRQLLIIFCDGLVKYPGDAERTEKGLQVLEKWVDMVVERGCSTLFQKNAIITHRGIKKGGGGMA